MISGNLEEHVAESPKWIQVLVDRVLESIEPLNLMGPLGYRWIEPECELNPGSAWVIGLHPTPNEAYGGQHDGQKLFPGFALNITYLLQAFSDVGEVVWTSPAHYNGDLDGPEVSIKGYFSGYPVWLRIFTLPPADEEASLVVDLATGEFWDKSGPGG